MPLTDAQWDWIVRIAIVLLGFLLKKAPWYPTKFVPIASTLLSVLVRILAGLGVDLHTVAGDAAIATGAYSGSKNVIEGVLAILKGGWAAVLGRASKPK